MNDNIFFEQFEDEAIQRIIKFSNCSKKLNIWLNHSFRPFTERQKKEYKMVLDNYLKEVKNE